jgi:hypothetical protein
MPFIFMVIFTMFLSANGGLLTVDWSQAKINSKMQKSLKVSKQIKKSVNSITLPVLLPRYYLNRKDIQIVHTPNFYTATIPLKGARLMILGDRTYQREVKVKDKNLLKRVKSLSNRFNIDNGMVAIYFTRYGVNYSLSIECDNPKGDSRCKSKDFLEKIYNSLVVAGGRR